MREPAEHDRNDPYRAQVTRLEFTPAAEDRSLSSSREPIQATGMPLPTGSGGRPLQESSFRPIPPPGRALTSSSDESHAQRAMGMFKQAMPFVQRLLPLLDGNVIAAVTNLINSKSQQPPQQPVDLAPVHTHLNDLQVQHTDLRTEVMEQTTTLKRVQDQLNMVREATDRNTLEQQELIHDLKAVGTKVNIFALLLLVMLVVSVALNLVLFLHLKQVIP